MKKKNNDVVKVLMFWAMSAWVDAEDELLQFSPLNPSMATQAKTLQEGQLQAKTAQTKQAPAHKSVKASADAHPSQQGDLSTKSTDSRILNKKNKRPDAKWVPRHRVNHELSLVTKADHRDARLSSSKTVSGREHTGIVNAPKNSQNRPLTSTKATGQWQPRKRLTSSPVQDEPAANMLRVKVAPQVRQMEAAGKQKLNQPSSTTTTLTTQPVKAPEKLTRNLSPANSAPAAAAVHVVDYHTDNTRAVSKLQNTQTSDSHHVDTADPRKGVAISSQPSPPPLRNAEERQPLAEAQHRDPNITRSTVADTPRPAVVAKPIVTSKVLPSTKVSAAIPPEVTSMTYQGIAGKTLEVRHSERQRSANNGLAKTDLAVTVAHPSKYTTSSQTVTSTHLQQHLPEESQVAKPQRTQITVSDLAKLKVKSSSMVKSVASGNKLIANPQPSQAVVKAPSPESTNFRWSSPNDKPFSSISKGEKLDRVIVIAPPQSLVRKDVGGGSDLKALVARDDFGSDKSSIEQITVTNYATNTRDFLRQVIQESMNYSPEIKGQQANSIAAGYDADQVKGLRWPQISVGAATPMRSVGSGNRNPSNRLSDSFTTVSATTNIYDFGMTSAKIDAAENTKESSIYTLAMTRNQIAGQLLKQILQLRQYQEQLAVTKKFHARMSKLTDMMSQIVEKDPGRGSELVQARAKSLEADTNIRNTEHSLENTQIAIMRLIGHRLTLPIGLDFGHISMSKNQILTALTVHPKLLADKEDYDAAINRTKAADADKYPRINWVVSKSTEKDEDGHQDAWQTGVQLQWNLFSGGSTVASVKAAASRASASKMQFATDRLEIENQIENLLFQKTSSQLRSKDYQKLIKETDKVSKMFYEQWYYLGKRSLLDVLTSETDHFNQQLSEIQIRYEGYQASTGLLVQTVNLLPWAGVTF